MLNQKKVSKSGSITIPSHIRRDGEILPGEKIIIEECESGNLLLRRVDAVCIFCQGDKTVRAFKGKFVCENCREELMKNGK